MGYQDIDVNLTEEQIATPDKCPECTNPITEKAVYPVYDDDGNLASTIEIDIETSKIKVDQERQEEYIETLKKKVAEITEEKQVLLRSENILSPQEAGN